jgi:hypothetical protein
MRVVPCAALTTFAILVGGGAAHGQDGPTPPPLAPAITDVEADWAKGQIRIEAEVVPRGAEVEKVFFRYRGERFKAIHGRRWSWLRTVEAHDDDGRGDRIRVKVRACTATACATRIVRVVAS